MSPPSDVHFSSFHARLLALAPRKFNLIPLEYTFLMDLYMNSESGPIFRGVKLSRPPDFIRPVTTVVCTHRRCAYLIFALRGSVHQMSWISRVYTPPNSGNGRNLRFSVLSTISHLFDSHWLLWCSASLFLLNKICFYQDTPKLAGKQARQAKTPRPKNLKVRFATLHSSFGMFRPSFPTALTA